MQKKLVEQHAEQLAQQAEQLAHLEKLKKELMDEHTEQQLALQESVSFKSTSEVCGAACVQSSLANCSAEV